MPAHTEMQVLPYTTRQLFALVADIEHYPEFLPWCRAARILERGDNEFLGELIISFSHMSERYTSRVTLTPPAEENAPGSIDVALVKGPFSHLTNRWEFRPMDGGGSEIRFFLDFQFKSRLLESLIGGVFAKATLKMVEAFRERAEQLYGRRA
jgi:coenzyme Q-binding protein COQ10